MPNPEANKKYVIFLFNLRTEERKTDRPSMDRSVLCAARRLARTARAVRGGTSYICEGRDRRPCGYHNINYFLTATPSAWNFAISSSL